MNTSNVYDFGSYTATADRKRDYGVSFRVTGTDTVALVPFRAPMRIYDLGVIGYKLKEAFIDVVLEYAHGEVLACMPELELYGEGDDDSIAVADLKCLLLDLFDDLNDTPDTELGDMPKAWKRIVNRMIEKV